MAIAFGQSASVSKVVAAIRNFNGGVSQQEIIAATGLSERTVKYALKALKRQQLVSELMLFCDMRKKVFYIGGEKNGNK